MSKPKIPLSQDPRMDRLAEIVKEQTADRREAFDHYLAEQAEQGHVVEENHEVIRPPK